LKFPRIIFLSLGYFLHMCHETCVSHFSFQSFS
jgi:hypothetical protein